MILFDLKYNIHFIFPQTKAKHHIIISNTILPGLVSTTVSGKPHNHLNQLFVVINLTDTFFVIFKKLSKKQILVTSQDTDPDRSLVASCVGTKNR